MKFKYHNFLITFLSMSCLLSIKLTAMNPNINVNINRETEWQEIPKDVKVFILSQVTAQPTLEEAFKALNTLRLLSKEYSKAVKESILKFTIENLEKKFGYSADDIYDWISKKLKEAKGSWINQEELEKLFPSKLKLNKQLLEAAKAQNLDDAKKLIEGGADVNARDENGNTSLMFASAAGNTELAKFLIESGADASIKNKKDESAFSFLITRKAPQTEIAKLLINAGADIDFITYFGIKTPALQYINTRLAGLWPLTEEQTRNLEEIRKLLEEKLSR